MKNTMQNWNGISRMREPAASAALTFAAVVVLAVITAQSSPAQVTFTTLVNFDSTNGANPIRSSLVQGTDGNLYGTTVSGGADEAGTVFKVTPGGTLTTLHSFAGTSVSPADGAYPWSGLVLGANGIFYGTTLEGGANNAGTVFSMTKAGVVTVLHSFCSVGPHCDDGSGPEASLLQASNGTFYGTTAGGGANTYGTLFSITAAGKLTTLYTFCSVNGNAACLDGQYPEGALIQASDGTFYGTTSEGGANGAGTVYSITSGGTLTTLYSLCSVNGIIDGNPVACLDGDSPQSALVQASNGNFYGTTPGGGNLTHTGTIFSITSGGTLTTRYSFCAQPSCTDGENPYAGLIQASDGNFYGTTNGGGANDVCDVSGSAAGCGTLFEIEADGTLTTLHSFDNTDGANYESGSALVQATNGTFYGTAYGGGTDTLGTLYSLSVGLSPFVETVASSGKVGTAVTILGTALTGATSVAFNGTAATFKVVSSSEITATVPADATSGSVTVTTPSASLTSNQQFLVTTTTSTGVALSPATTTLATEPDGKASPAKTVTLTNQSSATITSITPSIGGTNAGTSDFSFAGGTCGTSLAASSSCTYLITFTPSVVGTETANLSVADSVGTQTAALKGTGLGAALLPATTTFATEPDGTMSPAKTITLFNYTASTMNVLSAGAIGGTNAADFSITGGTCVGLSSLAGPSSCTYTVTFTPSLVGAETATLSVTDDFDHVVGTQTATLKGTGTQ